MPRLDQATIRTVRHALIKFSRSPNPTNLTNLQEIVMAIESLQDDPVEIASKPAPPPPAEPDPEPELELELEEDGA
jgi:hypothetical protein